MMSVFPPNVILDAAGAPIGLYRENQDPAEATRLHPVPRTNSLGEPILDARGEAEIAMLPLDHPRTIELLASQGKTVEGSVIVDIEEPTSP